MKRKKKGILLKPLAYEVKEGVVGFEPGRATFTMNEMAQIVEEIISSVGASKIIRASLLLEKYSDEEISRIIKPFAKRRISPEADVLRRTMIVVTKHIQETVGKKFTSIVEAEKYKEEFLDYFGREDFFQLEATKKMSFNDKQKEKVILFLVDHGYRPNESNIHILTIVCLQMFATIREDVQREFLEYKNGIKTFDLQDEENEEMNR